ncbi:MAG: hypothetical protein KatS3mg068_0797 [Candidatus Sericytochromatia bacterium]|nr:MAG: hypothetical protein KatS3mg068_0797 [Candidatus Sericytochromatia bacterium]
MINFKDIEQKFNELDDENKQKFLSLINNFFDNIQKNNSLSALKSSFMKSDSPLPPPPPIPNMPPPPINMSNTIDNTGFNPLKTRNITTGPLTFNKPLQSTSIANRKKYLSILEALDYICPVITDLGREALNPKRMIESDIYKFLKLVSENNISLKEVYIMEFSNKYKLGKFLEKVYQMSKEKYFVYRKNKSLNENEEINSRIGDLLLELNFINQEQLDLALKIQKGEADFPKETNINDNLNKGMLNIAQQVMQKINVSNNNTNLPKQKLLLGNILVELKYISKEQLDYVLGLQRWFKYALEITK